MRPLYPSLATALALFFCLESPAWPQVSARSLGLGDIAQIAEQRLAQPGAGQEPPGFSSSSWLAAMPSISISYLESDESQGTDETELSLNLPLKSGFGRRQDEELRTLAATIAATEQERRRLYVSGLVREALWSERIARTKARHTESKISLLQKLLDRQQDLLEARSASRYSLLLIRQELADATILLEDQRLEVQQWQQRYRQLTGLGKPPEVIEEPAPATEAPWHTHPDLRLLELGWQQQRARIAAASQKAAPMTLSITARQQDSKQLEENQYGLALEVPLSFFDTVAESSHSEWREIAREYWQQRDELQLALAGRWQQLHQEAIHLETRQSLLEKSVSISEEIVAESRFLLERNELGSEIWLRRLLGSIDRQAEAAINELLIGQNRAMSLQTSGIPL